MSDLSSLLKSDMSLFFSFVLSHPLHFTFLIFFSSYLHAILSFLLPLFLTTSLLLLAALTFIPKFSPDPEDIGIEPSSLSALVRALRAKIDSRREEHLRLEDFEVFRVVFEHPEMPDHEESEPESESTAFLDAADSAFSTPDEELGVGSCFDGCSVQEDERLGSLWEEFDDSEKGKVEETAFAPFCTGPDKVVLEGNGSGSEATGCNDLVGSKENGNSSHGSTPSSVDTWSLSQNSHVTSASSDGDFSLPSPVGSDYSFGSYGSMRKEKEWKRTLACKLFEERNNGGAGHGEGEGMDMLWETTYEMESRKRNKNVKKAKDKKKYEIEEEDDDDDDEREPNAQLCCLQALNFSTRKMSLGMGKPNLMKISKAIKGIGWLHGLKRHSKKVHNGDGDK